MTFSPFKLMSRTCLGVDIGSSSIKIVELSKSGKRIKLENYVEARVSNKKYLRPEKEKKILFSAQEIAQTIRSVLDRENIGTKKAVFTIPDFSSFFTWFNMPQMEEAEISEAVKYEARQHIPFPLTEVVLDWQIIERGAREDKIKILLVAVPNEIINRYSQIATLAKLEIQSLEAEAFAFCRSSVKDKNQTIALVDIGARTTNCSIIDKGVLKRSYSFDLSGEELTQMVSKSLKVPEPRAEEIKKNYELFLKQKGLKEILLPLVGVILTEIKKVIENFYQLESKGVQKIILGGGSAWLPGIKEYFEEELKKEVEIASPFTGIFYPPILEKNLKEMSPSYAIAVGAALRGLE